MQIHTVAEVKTEAEIKANHSKILCKSSLFCYPLFCHFWLTRCDCAFPFFSQKVSRNLPYQTHQTEILCLQMGSIHCMCVGMMLNWSAINDENDEEKSFVFTHWLWSMNKYVLSNSKAILLGWLVLPWRGFAWDERCWVFFKSGSFRLNMQISQTELKISHFISMEYRNESERGKVSCDWATDCACAPTLCCKSHTNNENTHQWNSHG